MFRVTTNLKRLNSNQPVTRRTGARTDIAPMVIWNLTRTCNLECVHCYASSKQRDYMGEVTTEKAFEVLEQLKEARCNTLVLSGGEPLYREDLFKIAKRAKELGFYLALSSNGTMIEEREAELLKTSGFDYIGVSLDGIGALHDKFRRSEGAFDLALRGLRLCRDKGLRTGVRFTLTKMNEADLPKMFDLVEKNRIDKIYISHLVFSGRGVENSCEALEPERTREAVSLIMERALYYVENNIPIEVVTGNNDADAVFFFMEYAAKNPAKAEKLMMMLENWGGNNAGLGVANIDPLGEVHPDPLMSGVKLGNVKDGSFGKIWHQSENAILNRLRERPRPLLGRCGKCEWVKICGGNSRTRSERAAGDLMASDPACYLTDEEIFQQATGISNSCKF